MRHCISSYAGVFDEPGDSAGVAEKGGNISRVKARQYLSWFCWPCWKARQYLSGVADTSQFFRSFIWRDLSLVTNSLKSSSSRLTGLVTKSESQTWPSSRSYSNLLESTDRADRVWESVRFLVDMKTLLVFLRQRQSGQKVVADTLDVCWRMLT